MAFHTEPDANKIHIPYSQRDNFDSILFEKDKIYNILDYGADPTGAIDSKTAIQSACDAAYRAGGGTVYVPSGHYLISSVINVKDNVQLTGTGVSSWIESTSTASQSINCDVIATGNIGDITGGNGLFAETTYSIKTVLPGDTIVTFKTASDAAIFVVGDIVVLTSYEFNNAGLPDDDLPLYQNLNVIKWKSSDKIKLMYPAKDSLTALVGYPKIRRISGAVNGYGGQPLWMAKNVTISNLKLSKTHPFCSSYAVFACGINNRYENLLIDSVASMLGSNGLAYSIVRDISGTYSWNVGDLDDFQNDNLYENIIAKRFSRATDLPGGLIGFSCNRGSDCIIRNLNVDLGGIGDVHFSLMHRGIIENSVIVAAGDYGIETGFGRGVIVRNNLIRGVNGSGIYVWSRSSKIIGNTIQDVGLTGEAASIYLPGSGTFVYDCVIANNILGVAASRTSYDRIATYPAFGSPTSIIGIIQGNIPDAVNLTSGVKTNYYLIAASNATTNEKTYADVTSDGMADQTEINAALTAGYNVKLSTGAFNIAAPITAAVNNVTIEGAGKEKTTIFLSNGSNCNVLTIGGNHWTIKNLLMNGNDAGNPVSGLCGIYGPSKLDVIIDNCEIKNVRDVGIEPHDVSSMWNITNCYIHDVGIAIAGSGFSGAEGGPSNIKISECSFNNTTKGSQIQVQVDPDVAAPYNWTIDHCLFSGTTGYMGILFDRSKNCNVTNSYFDVGECPGTGTPANIRYYKGASGTISNNTFVGAGNPAASESFTNINIWGGSDIRIIGNYFTDLNSKNGCGIAVEAYKNGYDVNNLIIEGNTFYNISTTIVKPAIILSAEDATYTISKVNIIGNIFTDDRVANSVCSYAIGAAGAGTVKNVSIFNNMIEGMLDYGIVLVANSIEDLIISNNMFKDVPVGIEATDWSNLIIHSNRFTNCKYPMNK
jgi:hypothetical protein